MEQRKVIKMKIIDMKGLVLSETNYGDTSKILNVLTEEYGVIGILSKGCRSLKSKLRGTSRKLVYGTFHFYYKEAGLSTLISIDVIDDYPRVLMDLEAIVYASGILDLTRQVAKQTESKGILALASSVLTKINQGLEASVMSNILELKYLSYLGVSPTVDGCAICGKTSNIVSISPTAGGFVCGNCYQQQDCNDGYYSEKAIQLLRMYYYIDIDKISKVEVSPKTNKEINRFLEDYYERYTGIFLKSKKMLKNISKVGK